MRDLITDYALFMAVAVAIGASYAPSILHSLDNIDNTTLERIELPTSYGVLQNPMRSIAVKLPVPACASNFTSSSLMF